jgi:hypothetical protein
MVFGMLHLFMGMVMVYTTNGCTSTFPLDVTILENGVFVPNIM